MTTAARPMTADDLLGMPDDGFRYELVRGELRKMSPAGYDHGKYTNRIGASMEVHVDLNELGETSSADTGFQLADDHVRVPDVAYLRAERGDASGSRPGFYPGPPDIAVEVISPSDRQPDIDEKVADYLEAGTLAVILVNPRNMSVTIIRPLAEPVVLAEGDTLVIPDIIPGWSMPVVNIFYSRRERRAR